MMASRSGLQHATEVIYESVRAPQEYVRAYNTLMAEPTNQLRIRAVAGILHRIGEPIDRVVDIASGGGAYVAEARRALHGQPRFFAADRQFACVAGYRLNHPASVGARADVTSLPFRRGSFDLAMCLDIVEHLDDDIAFLRGVGNLLRPGGWVVVSTHNSRSLQHVIGLLTSAVQGKAWLGWDPTHVRFYTVRSLREKLKAAGLEAVAFQGTYYLPYHLPARIVSWLLDRAGFGGAARVAYGVFRAPAYALNYPFELMSAVPGIRGAGWGIIVLARKR
jgi:2-polyprenyl-3-methyl-5-hydroxy-6-metoxy-1,4-benzoquinol methylase